MTVYRGTGNAKKDTKKIGTYYTDSLEEAKFYGDDIETLDISKMMLYTYSESELKELLNNWLESLDDNEKNYQESTEAYFTNQTDEVLAVKDAAGRGYDGIVLDEKEGESGEICKYIIIF